MLLCFTVCMYTHTHMTYALGHGVKMYLLLWVIMKKALKATPMSCPAEIWGGVLCQPGILCPGYTTIFRPLISTHVSVHCVTTTLHFPGGWLVGVE